MSSPAAPPGGQRPGDVPAAHDAYDATLGWMLGLEARRGMDFKLARVAAALAAVGNPQRAFRAIHVAGTNGKGSVSAMAEAILRAAGVRTGLYTSPHLVDFRERIRVAGAWVPRAAVVEDVARVRACVDVAATGLTFFELATIIAFLHFARERVEVAVVEVGLGGRLDATNVIDGDVAVITSIGFDHEAFLGNTLAAIAGEKAGILRAGRPAIIGALPPEAMAVVEAAALRVGAPLLRLGREIRAETGAAGMDFRGPRRTLSGLRPGLHGRHQVGNAALAIAAVDELLPAKVGERAVRAGIEAVCWPGRLEVVRADPPLLLDAAHNPDGMRVLARELPGLVGGRPVHLVFGVLGDKRWEEMVDAIAPRVARVSVVRVPVARTAEPDVVARRFARYCPADVVEDPREAVSRAVAGASSGAAAVVVAGSVFLIGAVRELCAGTAGPEQAQPADGGRPVG